MDSQLLTFTSAFFSKVKLFVVFSKSISFIFDLERLIPPNSLA